jgi:uncharacterized protein YjeT (DUF2065 family)
MDLSTYIGFMALALAIFTIGLPDIHPTALSLIFIGRLPQTDKDIKVIHKFMGLLGMLGYFAFLVLLFLLIQGWATSEASQIITSPNSQWLRAIIGIILGILGVVIVYALARFAWHKAEQAVEKDELLATKNEITKETEETYKVGQGYDSNSAKEIATKILRMDGAQLRAFNNYLNYLKKSGKK